MSGEISRETDKEKAFESRQDDLNKIKLCIMPDSTSALQNYDRAMTGFSIAQ
jgi:hypothetical protein